MLKIVVVAYDNCLQSGLAAVLDLLALANWQQKRLHKGSSGVFCRTEVVSCDGEPITSFNRQPVCVSGSIADCERPDLVIVPGMLGRPEVLMENTALIKWLKAQHKAGTVIASACSGAFALAAAGILNKRQATTHWQLADRFRKHFPRVDLRVDHMLIDGGDYLTAGGTGAHSDLALALIERYASAELATACARMMLIDGESRDQAPFVAFRGSRSHGDKVILELQQWMERDFRSGISVKAMAQQSGLIERTLLRRFRRATGESPLEYLQRIRVEKAKQLLLKSDKSLAEITTTVGYVDLSSFRRLFVQIVGISPAVYRKRFGN